MNVVIGVVGDGRSAGDLTLKEFVERTAPGDNGIVRARCDDGVFQVVFKNGDRMSVIVEDGYKGSLEDLRNEWIGVLKGLQ